MKNILTRLRKILIELVPYAPFTYTEIINKLLNGVLSDINRGGASLLDVGCGRGTMMDFLRLRRRIYKIGVDIFEPYLKEAKLKRRYDDVVVVDAKYLPFRERAFNIIIALHIIEHLRKEDGFKLIKNLESLSKNFILFVTPLGHMHIDIVDNNPYQVHLSAWYPNEFRALGYNVKGLWLKIIWGDKGIAKKLPPPLQRIAILLNYLFAPLAYFFPEIAGCIIVYKEFSSH
jgi:SAM-dependent methyltransferase